MLEAGSEPMRAKKRSTKIGKSEEISSFEVVDVLF